MIFSEYSRYGWGASNIAMPRTEFESHPDKLQKTDKSPFKKRRQAAYPWHAESISKIILNDYPWDQALLLFFLSLFVIVATHLLNKPVSIDRTQAPAKPVEVIVAMNDSEQQPQIHPVDPPEFQPIEPEVVMEPIAQMPTSKVLPPPIEGKQDLPKDIQKKNPKLPSPPAAKIKRLLNKNASEPKDMSLATPILKNQSEPDKISLLPPNRRMRKYSEKKSMAALLPSQDNATPELTSRKVQQLSGDIAVAGCLDAACRNSENNHQMLTDTSPNTFQLKKPTSRAFNRSDQKAELMTPRKIDVTKKHYTPEMNASLPTAPSAPLGSDWQASIPSQSSTKLSMPAPKKLNGHFATDSLSNITASQETGQMLQTAGQGITFPSQKQREEPKPDSPMTAEFVSKAKPLAKKKSKPSVKAQYFQKADIPAEIDPSELTNLREFNVCIDPEKEFYLKTQLAMQLDCASRIEADGIVFFVRYVESGYTIEINVYNPQGHIFQDRCEVLQIALEAIDNRLS